MISYVGRHNEIKGYDALKEIGKHLLDANDSAYVFIAGTEGPLYHWNTTAGLKWAGRKIRDQ